MPGTESVGQRWVIGIGGLEVRCAPAGVIITHALGSCIGVAVHDPYAHVGGMLHAQMPSSAKSPDLARSDPGRFVDLGVPLLFQRAVEAGADKRRLRIAVAGAANMSAVANPLFDIGQQNLTALRKALWRLGALIAAEETGGSIPRTFSLDLATGATTVQSGAERRQL
ncbi:MAG: chemotaxis protein CheD [Planctomycetes bacterium]|nr:chemotaxis protein CheD [Planctomycetota bacterium]